MKNRLDIQVDRISELTDLLTKMHNNFGKQEFWIYYQKFEDTVKIQNIEDEVNDAARHR